ncbi:cob(I)yrinic acid a,c-diamide adenosyltransferase [Candidatus Woesearchaeota archaeon]|nr:cob(I)yrinic acid a,c-diamide adenosyltransferase [Candidatus Woesearchaeota archaeon]
MACYTCTGDDGTTCILGKYDIDKDDERIEALGCFDELNAVVGVVAAFSTMSAPADKLSLSGKESEDDVGTGRQAFPLRESTVGLLKSIQDDVHTICAELAAELDGMPRITEKHVERIEKAIDDAEKFLEPQRSFIFPGGDREAALLHFARTVARRAERQLVRLAKTAKINPLLLKYANRLSSLFHVMARVENKKADVKEEKPSYKYYNRT